MRSSDLARSFTVGADHRPLAVGPPCVSSPSALARFVLFAVKEHHMHNLHREAAKQHQLAAQAHRTASEHNEKGDNPSGNWHNQRAIEYSDRAYELAKEAESKSGKIGSLENVYAL